MENPFKRFLREYFKFSRSDRNAILILSALILLVAIASIIVNSLEPKSSFDLSEYIEIVNEWEEEKDKTDNPKKFLFTFDPNVITTQKLDSLQIPDFIKRNIVNYRNAGGKFYSATDFRKIYGVNDSVYELIKPYLKFEKERLPAQTVTAKVKKQITGHFDPNVAEFDVLKKFGFSDFQAGNLLKFRKNGGRFRKPGDLKKIYGIDTLFYSNICKYILIEINESEILNETKPVMLNVEINGADTTELMQLRGIGSVYARRIVKYRNLLGGFYSKKQLLEVYNFSDETYEQVKAHISIDTTLIKKIRINFAEYSDLLRHPYLNNKQVKSILDHRNKNGTIADIAQIQAIESIDVETFKKLEPYFTCR